MYEHNIYHHIYSLVIILQQTYFKINIKKRPVIYYSIFIKEMVLMLYDKKVEYLFLIFDTIMFLKF